MPVPTGLPTLTPSDRALAATRFAAWFPLYRKHTPKATIIQLDEVQPDFVDWLNDDGLILPRDKADEQTGDHNDARNEDEEHDRDDDDDDDGDDDDDETSARDFTSLSAEIRRVIDEYEGGVFPKLDWSAPLDAAWIVPGGTLRCTAPSDVYLLLKSSDFVAKDVAQLRELGTMRQRSAGEDSAMVCDTALPSPHLVLKKYFAMPTSHEFRCFVRAGRLVAISQRDTGTFFEHLQTAEQQSSIRRKLLDFYEDVLWPNHAGLDASNIADGKDARHRQFALADFVWDAYLTRDQGRVFIVDINPFLERTDALLWTWSEIEEEAERQHVGHVTAPAGGRISEEAPRDKDSLPSLRLVASRAETMHSFPTYAHNMVPSDVIGLSQGNDIASFARDFNAQLAEAAAGTSNE